MWTYLWGATIQPSGFPGDAMRCRFDPWVRKIPWRRAWQPTPVFLPGESHGQRSLAGYSPWGHTESDMTQRLSSSSSSYRTSILGHCHLTTVLLSLLPILLFFFFNITVNVLIYFWLPWVLCCFVQAFSSCDRWGLLSS